ncbi:hypothetical protein [Poseidonocella sedimentorum]|uniref:TspO/MBR family protein n=1 Tax=Poseidonocella sedimentorum TaxID=871652 RepID=A0A1I6DEA0_9RHOB|nr:hypothetical protein [Poseidonocella sedimentorum]SFR03708.1 hypothetical protein SAMN04515673_10356 [Poseidonocella sedimentorum]
MSAGSDKVLPALVLGAAVLFMLSPLLVPGFGGFEPDQFPYPQIDPPVQPAGYAFAIWGLLYVWLVAGAAYGLWRRARDAAWGAMRLPLLVSLGVGMTWLPVAKLSPIAATILIWVMLIAALAALARAPSGGGADRWLGRAPVALYAGWLTAAACVALGVTAAGYHLLWQGPVVWAVPSLLLAVGIAGGVLSVWKATPFYGLSVIWALVAVVVANVGGGSLLIGGIALVATLALIVMTLRNISDWS